MPVPYRKTPRAAEIGLVACLDILWSPSERAFYGGLLVIDGVGQPQEFVHNTLAAPTGLLWSDQQVYRLGIPRMAHSLFDACRREPDLLMCLSSLGTAEQLRTNIAPAVPFARITPASEEIPAEWVWINSPPTEGMRAALLAQELTNQGFVTEPFQRTNLALHLVYPNADWRGIDAAAHPA